MSDVANVWECLGCHRVFGFFNLDQEPVPVPEGVTCPARCAPPTFTVRVKPDVCSHASPCQFPRACARCAN